MAFELPQLGYAHDALEPHFDARTMEIHHGKHHAGYTSKLNAAVEGTDMEGKSIEELLANHSDNAAIRNNGGGYYNHCLFWEVLSPNSFCLMLLSRSFTFSLTSLVTLLSGMCAILATCISTRS